MTQKLVTFNHNHDQFITIPEFNKFAAEILAARLSLVN